MSFESFYTIWHSAKSALQLEGLFTANELHVYIGLIIYGFTFYLLRHTKFPALFALFCVSVLQIFNEFLDSMLGMYMHALPNIQLTILDCLLTLAVPVVLTLIYLTLTVTGVRKSIPPPAV